jgi:predicted tellurium resistance membrane protein TerC
MFSWMTGIEGWIALGILAALEIVLGIDNIIFISILVGCLPATKRNITRNTGLLLAMLMRLALLFSIVWVIGLTEPWFSVLGIDISGRGIILIGGGLFLMAKATHEIHNSLEGVQETALKHGKASMARFYLRLLSWSSLLS